MPTLSKLVVVPIAALLIALFAPPAAASATTTRWGTLEVQAAWPIQPGDTIKVRGNGFLPNRQIFIRLGTTGNAFPMVDGSGAFPWTTVHVPGFLETNRTHQLRAVQYGGVEDAEARWDIFMPNFHPWAFPSKWYALPGETLTISGRGFMAGETVRLRVNGAPAGSAVATSAFMTEGRLNNAIAFTVPSTLQNSSVGMVLVGDTSGAQAPFGVYVGQR